MNDIVLISGPVGEPVSVQDMYNQLGMTAPSDDVLNNVMAAKLKRNIRAARRMCETYTRSVYLTQKWLLKRDGFPTVDERYHDDYRHQFYLPKLPFQSLEFVQYVDTSGILQTLQQDTSYGTDIAAPQYGFQLIAGGDTQPARLLPPWARPWPPTRRVPANVLVQFKCGFGGPITGVTMNANAAVMVGAKFVPGDVGQPVTVPGAGTNGEDLQTSIFSVDESGQATLAEDVLVAIGPATAIWVGKPVPDSILEAITLQAEFLFTQGGDVDVPLPRVIQLLLDEHRNLVA